MNNAKHIFLVSTVSVAMLFVVGFILHQVTGYVEAYSFVFPIGIAGLSAYISHNQHKRNKLEANYESME